MADVTTNQVVAGDRCTVKYHEHGLVARVITVAEGYAMLRYKGCAPFVAKLTDLIEVTR